MTNRYQVLARKYRPQAFRDVVGQEAAVTTLKNAIRFDKVAHAYLFCGSRGVGKTTLARLFAKALNCQSLTPDLEPCNQCPSCLEIVSGQSLDVIEIDGASNRGIDDIRQINETVGYAPSHGKYKIYIIDEVHMLTKEAFNALLKTLEEPPEQAKFFFATTEAHKVLPTIISRCQRFDLARIQPTLITTKLQHIAADLSRTVEPEALQLIARFAEGSLRDAESLFDQILCFADGTVTAAIVRQSLGLVPQELFLTLDQAFATYHLAAAFELVDQLFQTGKDLAHFLEQLIEHYRNITLSRTLNTPHPSAKLYTQQQALFILDLLINAEATFQKSPYPRIALESILLQIIRSRHRIPVEVLVRTLTENAECKTLNAKLAEIEVPAAPQPVVSEKPKIEVPPPQPTVVEAPKVEMPAPIVQPLAIEKPKAEAPPPPQPTVVEAPKVVMPAPIVQPLAIEKPKAEAPLPPQPTVVEAPKVEMPGPIVQPLAVEEPKAIPPSPKPPELKPVPFHPYDAKPQDFKKVDAAPLKHPSHYDTLIRFAAIELEGTVKN